MDASRDFDGTGHAAEMAAHAHDEARVIVDGQEIPPYEGAVAYLRSAADEYGIEYEDGRVDWLGDAHRAFGDDATIEVHPDSEEG